MTWINVNDLKKQLDDFTLGPIHLSIEPGTITALIGNNGSGKSTFLKILMNFINQDQGSLHFFGEPTLTNEKEWKEKVAYLPQKPIGMEPYNGETLANLYDLTYPSFDWKTFNHLLEKFKVNKRKTFQKLSPGEQQKLRIALTFATNAKVLILDEPTAFIDIQARNYLLDYIIWWMDEKERSIILSTHHADEIRKLADYIVPINHGKMLGNYEKEALINHYREYIFQEVVLPVNIPGEIKRQGQSIISNAPDETEAFLNQEQLPFISQNRVELDEIIAFILEEKKKEN